MGCAPTINKLVQRPLSNDTVFNNNTKDIPQSQLEAVIEELTIKSFQKTFAKLRYKPDSTDDVIALIACISQVYTELYGWTSNKVLIDIYMHFQTIDNVLENSTNLHIQSQMNYLLESFSDQLNEQYGIQEEHIRGILAKNFAVNRQISIIVQQCLGITGNIIISAADIVSCLQITKYLANKIIDQQFIVQQINSFFMHIFNKFNIACDYILIDKKDNHMQVINIQNPLELYQQEIGLNYQVLYNHLSSSINLMEVQLVQLNISSNWSIYDEIVNRNNRFFLLKLYNHNKEQS